jgi:hypothetical protein
MDSKKYIGMDVRKESISIAVMNGAGKIVMECVIETKASMILQFIDGLRGDFGSCRAVTRIEAGSPASFLSVGGKRSNARAKSTVLSRPDKTAEAWPSKKRGTIRKFEGARRKKRKSMEPRFRALYIRALYICARPAGDKTSREPARTKSEGRLRQRRHRS